MDDRVQTEAKRRGLIRKNRDKGWHWNLVTPMDEFMPVSRRQVWNIIVFITFDIII